MANDLGEQVLRTNLGSYALYAFVASGGFGTVYFGRDLQSNRAVAIKRLHGHLAYQPELVERFEQEAQRLRGLQHPNIVQVLDDGKDGDGLPFIILQWVEGWTVAALLEKHGRFAITEAVEIASQVLAALQAAGERGVVHRDIKPANLMVTPPPDRHVKVMDFGIAKDLLANASGQFTQIGTIAYMAPEQFTQGRVDARTDLFALGVTLYELLTGQRPNGALAEESPTSLRELRPEVDPALAAIVYRALAKHPMDRFQTAAQMRAALEPFVGTAPVDLTIVAVDARASDPAPTQAPLAQLYAAGSQAFAAQAWSKAMELLEAVVALDPGYQDADALLAEARRRLTIADLYVEAREFHSARAWQAVLNILDRIRTLDPTFDDTEALGPTAREAVAADQRHQAAAALFRRGVAHLDASEWSQAIGVLEQLQSQQPGYPDLATVLAEARAGLARKLALQEESDRQARQALMAQAAAAPLAERHSRPPVARTSEPPPTGVAHQTNPPVEQLRPVIDGNARVEPAPMVADLAEPAPSARDANVADRRGWRRVGVPIWLGGVAALLAIGVLAQQVASRQTGQESVSTLAPVAQRTDVAPPAAAKVLPTDVPPPAGKVLPTDVQPPAAKVLPTDVPATAIPRPAIPATAAPTPAPVSTSTPAPTATTAPTATPTVDDVWRAVLVQIDPTWSRDWPATIGLLDAFRAAHPGFGPGEEKLYAARLFYADELLAAGDLDGAVDQLDAAQALLPERPEATQALVALTPTPTTTTSPPRVVNPPSAPRPIQPRPAPPPLRP
jgi:tetratricopeptide (TPR) repeat protein